jgi:hypothetical protein
MAVTLNANTSTGFIATSDTSGVLQLQTGGTTAVTVDASQNVGIGTVSPTVSDCLSAETERVLIYTQPSQYLYKEQIMSLTKTTNVDQITVTENGIVLYREATRIMEDGNELSKTYHRSSLTPGQDLTGVPANVVAICNVAWTEAVVAAYQAQLEANRPVGA